MAGANSEDPAAFVGSDEEQERPCRDYRTHWAQRDAGSPGSGPIRLRESSASPGDSRVGRSRVLGWSDYLSGLHLDPSPRGRSR